VVEQIQIPDAVAGMLAKRLRAGQSEVEQARQAALWRLTQRQQKVQAKLDRGTRTTYLESKISDAFWTRKSEAWEGQCSLRNTGSGQTAALARNRAIELHVQSRESLSHLR
jgi:hypothetical protein